MSFASFLKKWLRNNPRPQSKFRPRLESLEERWCPTSSGIDGYDLAGLGNSAATAVNLGTASPSKGLSFSQSNLSIDVAEDLDYYKFKFTGVPAADDSIDVGFLHANGDIDIRLYLLGDDGAISQVATSLSVDDNESISLQGLTAGTYVLRVYGTNDATNDYSLAIDLDPTGIVPPPTDSFPTLNPTGVNGQINRLRPTLSWTASLNALVYQVWINDLTTGESNLYTNNLTLATSWSPPSDLVSGHTYRWWVRGIEFGGLAHAWSLHQDFTVSTVQIAPINGPIHDLHPNIAWTGVVGAESYKVWVNNVTTGQNDVFASGFAGFIGQDGWKLIGNSFILTPGQTYTIWARALNADGEGEWSAGQTFTVGAINFAQPVTAISELIPSIPFTPVAGVTNSVFWLDDLTSGQKNLFPNGQLTGDKWSPPAQLTIGHTYRLWGQALYPSNNGVGWWGPSIDFTINTSIYGIKPATTLRPTLSWTALPGVANYEVWVTLAGNPVNLTPGFVTANKSWTPTLDLISGHTYNIWVRAQGGVWSAKQTFQIAKVTEIKATKIGNQYEIAWTPLSLVSNYELWIADLTTGASNILPGVMVNQPGVVGSYSAKYTLAANLTNGHTYRVWIKARNSFTLGQWSDPFDFTATV
ncbi:MAG: fibronectin type III domain-containing protein [Gemmataceae bacterium]|nr:fibronectin type III domain-containing protein [Gemmataceae bacterium]